MSDESSSPEPETTSSRLPRLGWYAVIGLFLFSAVAVLGMAKNFLVPVLLAFLLSMVFAPIRRVFDRRGIPSALSATVIVGGLVLLVAGLLSVLLVPASQWVEQAPYIESQIQERLVELSRSVNGLVDLNGATAGETAASDTEGETASAPARAAATNVMRIAPLVLAQLMFTFILLLFLLASGDMFYEKLVHVLPSFGDKRRAMRIVFSIERKLSHYLMTITLINAGVGVIIGVAMRLLGMPDAALIGMMAFLLNFVPYLGPLVGLILVVVIAAISFGWLGWALIVGGVYLAIGTVEGQLVTPYFIGRRLRLNTVVVFVAVSFWAWLWSVIGMVVAVPVLVALRTICEHVDGLQSLGDFLSERHAERLDEESTAQA